MVLSIHDLYRLVKSVGFPDDTAIKMVAVALKESGGNTEVTNTRPPDNSWGLFQINMYGTLGPARRAQYGLSRNEDLFNPVVNARIAYDLWGGNDANIAKHWGTNIEPFATSYRQNLARVENVLGVPSSGPIYTANTFPVSTPEPVDSNEPIYVDDAVTIDQSGDTNMLLLAVLIGGAVVVGLALSQ